MPSATPRPEAKVCVACGRRLEWRKKWERDWDQVRYCSSGCRRRGVRDIDRDLEAAILELLAARARGATICPSEAARRVAPGPGEGRATGSTSGSAGADSGDAWRDLMESARRAARRLVADGRVEITQNGRVVDPSTASGPIRIRRTY
ncbi:MAG: DUF2256 and DUF3253 domain-containing protein [Ornithinimicrobium sp.]